MPQHAHACTQGEHQEEEECSLLASQRPQQHTHAVVNRVKRVRVKRVKAREARAREARVGA